MVSIQRRTRRRKKKPFHEKDAVRFFDGWGRAGGEAVNGTFHDKKKTGDFVLYGRKKKFFCIYTLWIIFLGKRNQFRLSAGR